MGQGEKKQGYMRETQIWKCVCLKWFAQDLVQGWSRGVSECFVWILLKDLGMFKPDSFVLGLFYTRLLTQWSTATLSCIYEWYKKWNRAFHTFLLVFPFLMRIWILCTTHQHLLTVQAGHCLELLASCHTPSSWICSWGLDPREAPEEWRCS